MTTLSLSIRSDAALGPRAVRGIVALGFAALLAVPTFAEGEGGGDWVIPPGREQILGKILGVGEELPGSCKLTKGDIQYSVVNATYFCDGTEVVLELAHPSQAQSDAAATTELFAISSKGGEVPPGLLSALESRVQANQDQFAWEQGVQQEASAESLPIQGPMLYVAGAAALLVIAVVGFILRRA